MSRVVTKVLKFSNSSLKFYKVTDLSNSQHIINATNCRSCFDIDFNIDPSIADCIRHIILDNFQPYNCVGIIIMVFHSRLLLQLLYRWYFCWVIVDGNARSEFLVYNSDNRHNMHCSCVSVAFLLCGCVPKLIRSCKIKATYGTNAISSKSRCTSNTICKKNKKVN